MKYKNQERYQQRNIERGLIKTTVWIPKQNKTDLRSKHERLQIGSLADPTEMEANNEY